MNIFIVLFSVCIFTARKPKSNIEYLIEKKKKRIHKHILAATLWMRKVNESAWDLCRRSYRNNAFYNINLVFLRLTPRKGINEWERKQTKISGQLFLARTFLRISSESPKVNGNLEIEAHFSCADLCVFFFSFSFRQLSFRLFCVCFFFVSLYVSNK